jgi:hypothetical protein
MKHTDKPHADGRTAMRRPSATLASSLADFKRDLDWRASRVDSSFSMAGIHGSETFVSRMVVTVDGGRQASLRKPESDFSMRCSYWRRRCEWEYWGTFLFCRRRSMSALRDCKRAICADTAERSCWNPERNDWSESRRSRLESMCSCRSMHCTRSAMDSKLVEGQAVGS